MCTHQRFVRNKYTGHHIYVKCGHCESCRQEAANRRARRIREHLASSDKIALFVTLTYHNDGVPYVWLSDLRQGMNNDGTTMINIWRNRRFRRNRIGSGYTFSQTSEYKPEVLDVVPLQCTRQSLKGIRSLQKASGRVGVIYYPDFQGFRDRLSINLKRKYNYEKKLEWFCSSEYGEHTQRPHFHALFFIEPRYKELFDHAIREAWPFNCNSSSGVVVEVALDASRYVASYVNCGSAVPAVLAKSSLRPKSHYMQGLASDLEQFSLASLLQKIERRDTTYAAVVTIDGVKQTRFLPVPKYIVNRFFPYFKGCHAFTRPALREFFKRNIKLQEYVNAQCLAFKCGDGLALHIIDENNFSNDDTRSIRVRLYNSYRRYCDNHPEENPSIEQFAEDYYDFYQARFITQMRQWYQNEDGIPLSEQFDNLGLMVHRPSSAPTLAVALQGQRLELDANKYAHVVEQTEYFSNEYRRRCKQRQVSDFIFSKLNSDLL